MDIDQIQKAFYKKFDIESGDESGEDIWNWIIENCTFKAIPIEPPVSQPSELLPCPFCGKQPILNKKESSFEILCPNCLIHGFQTIEKETAINLWNKRASQ